MSIAVSNHALLRFLERAGGLPIEHIRGSLAASLARAARAAASIKADEYKIVVDGVEYVVRNGVVVTVLFDGPQR